jgi:hypothetical protein
MTNAYYHCLALLLLALLLLLLLLLLLTAIPINKAKQIMYELAAGRTIAHAYVGIQMTTITPDFARQNNIDPNAPNVIPEVTMCAYAVLVASSHGFALLTAEVE